MYTTLESNHGCLRSIYKDGTKALELHQFCNIDGAFDIDI